MKRKYEKPHTEIINMLPVTICAGSSPSLPGGGNGGGAPADISSYEPILFEETDEEIPFGFESRGSWKY